MKAIRISAVVLFMVVLTTPSIGQSVRSKISYSDVSGFLTEWGKRDFHGCFERKFKNVKILYAEKIGKYKIKATGKVRYTYLGIPADREFTAIITYSKVTFTKECSTCSDDTKTCTTGTSTRNSYRSQLFYSY